MEIDTVRATPVSTGMLETLPTRGSGTRAVVKRQESFI